MALDARPASTASPSFFHSLNSTWLVQQTLTAEPRERELMLDLELAAALKEPSLDRRRDFLRLPLHKTTVSR